MRTFEEIDVDIISAVTINDAAGLRTLAAEMQELAGSESQARAFYAYGVAAAITGDYPTALANFRRVLSLFEELGGHARTRGVIGSIGNVHLYTGDYASALEHYRRALAMHEEVSDRAGAAVVIGNLSGLLRSTGDYPSALEYGRRALALYEELGDPSGIANATGNLGLLYSQSGDHDAALECLQHAMAQFQVLNDHNGVAMSSGHIVSVLMMLGRYDDAAALMEQQTHEVEDSPVVLAFLSSNKAQNAEHCNDLDGAQQHLQNALRVSTEAGLRDMSATYHLRLRDLAQRRNDFAAYIEHNNEYTRITEEIRGKEATQRMAMMEAERKVEGERREREKERALLYGALPRAVADRMIRGEKVTGDHYDEATVIFADIVGFTQISEQLSPGDVVMLLEKIFSAFDAVCEQHNVTKIKTIGDSYMAVSFDNVMNAVHCALEFNRIQHTIQNTECDPAMVQYRIGMHCGPVTAGVIGTQRLQYDVWGDTVNVASRMESSGSPGRIHISAAVATEIESSNKKVIVDQAYRIEERGEIDVKGKGMMLTYWIVPQRLT